MGEAPPLGVLETHLVVEVLHYHLRSQGEPELIRRRGHDMEEAQEVHEGDLDSLRVLLSVETKRVLGVVEPDVAFAEVLELAYEESCLRLFLNWLLRWVQVHKPFQTHSL